MQFNSTPFEKIRTRKLAVYAILALIGTYVSIDILSYFLPAWFKNRSSPLRSVLPGLLLYFFFFLFILRMLSRAGLSYNRLFGTFPAWRTIGRYGLWAVPSLVSPLHLPIFYFSRYLFFSRNLLRCGSLTFLQRWFGRAVRDMLLQIC